MFLNLSNLICFYLLINFWISKNFSLQVESPEIRYEGQKAIFGSPVSFYGAQITGEAWIAEYIPEEKKIILKEGVWAKLNNDVLVGDEWEIDLKNNTLLIKKGEVHQLKKGFFSHIEGEKITGNLEGKYTAEDASFTTCECEKDEAPSWSVKFKKAELEKDGYLTIHDAFFRIKNANIPFLYFPFLKLPSKISRQSGFLSPKFDYKTGLGFYAGLAYYQVLSEWSDMTFDLDYYEKKGLGFGSELRYVLPQGGWGNHYFYYINEYVGKNNNQIWYLNFNHREKFLNLQELDFHAYGKYYSDTRYLSDYARYVESAYLPYWEIRTYLKGEGRILSGGLIFEKYQINKNLPLRGYEDIFVIRSEIISENFNIFPHTQANLGSGIFAYGTELKKYGIYLIPSLKTEVGKFIHVGGDLKGNVRFSNVSLSEGEKKLNAGYKGEAFGKIPVQSIIEFPSTGENPLRLQHQIILKGGGVIQENWAEFPYGITSGFYYSVWSPRSKGGYLSFMNQFSLSVVSFYIAYSHYWVKDIAEGTDIIQLSEMRSNIYLFNGLIGSSFRGLYNPENGKWKYIAVNSNFHFPSGFNYAIGYTRADGSSQLTLRGGLSVLSRVSVNASSIYDMRGKKWVQNIFSLGYNSRQRCWFMTISFTQLFTYKSGKPSKDYVLSFQINLMGLGAWGRGESI